MRADLTYSDATRLAELIRTKEVSPVEVVQAHLDRIAAVNPKINAIVTLATGALDAAKAAEAAVLAGDELGPLHGVPFTVKDSIDTADVATQRGSPIFKDRVPGVDATSVARMKKAGGILLAKTNLPEFSYMVETDNLLTGRSNNPWDLTRTPGGSSGGEAAAIAAGMSPIGLGTDLAISVRGPASETGISSVTSSARGHTSPSYRAASGMSGRWLTPFATWLSSGIWPRGRGIDSIVLAILYIWSS
jgi:aspartyl-tRNA(Asn)/glutamyl-tRNA(Gln) amidotransferase subunit A